MSDSPMPMGAADAAIAAQFLARCISGDAMAIESLAACEAPEECWNHVCKQSLYGDQAALKVVLDLPEDCPFRAVWNIHREARRLEWLAVFEPVVLELLRLYLGTWSGYAEDCAQIFWGKFFRRDHDIHYDVSIAPEEAWIRRLLKLQKVDFVRAQRKYALEDKPKFLENIVATFPAAEIEAQIDRKHVPPMLQYLGTLVHAGRLAPHEALVMLASRVAGIGPTKLASRYLDITLFDLCRVVADQTYEQTGYDGPGLFRDLEQRLAIPRDEPAGAKTLRQLLEAAGRQRDPAGALRIWSANAARICRSGTENRTWEERENLSAKFLKAYRTKRELEWGIFAKASHEPNSVTPAILWGSVRILGLKADGLLQRNIRQIARELVEHVPRRLPGIDTLPVLTRVFETAPDLCAFRYLDQEGARMDQIIERFDARLRRPPVKENAQ